MNIDQVQEINQMQPDKDYPEIDLIQISGSDIQSPSVPNQLVQQSSELEFGDAQWQGITSFIIYKW